MRVRALSALTMAHLVETSKTIWFVKIQHGIKKKQPTCAVVCKGSRFTMARLVVTSKTISFVTIDHGMSKV
jgi:hypothetical protein